MHISSEHWDEPCKKFAANKCTFGNRCLFKHILKPVNIVPQQQRDFHEGPTGRIGSPGVGMPPQETPTRRPYSLVVGDRGRNQMSDQIQEQNLVRATQSILTKMIPDLVIRIMETLNQQ